MRRDGGLRIVVLGYVVGFPLGGMTWHTVQYPMGLAALGHDVWVVEDSNDWDNCYDPSTGEVTDDPTYGLRYAADVYDRVGVGGRWAYHRASDGSWLGPAADRILGVCRGADLVINLAGIHPLRSWLVDVPVRLFVDADPAFTQVRHLSDPRAAAHASDHTHFSSFGENVAAGRSSVPDDGLPWGATRQPIVLDAWPVTPVPAGGRFTTVMQWDSYAAAEHAGVRYGMKSHSFLPFVDLPQRTTASLEVALGRGRGAVEQLRQAGWVVSDPQEATWDPWVYQGYVTRSMGEWSVAKHGYVASRSAWFSERSACYLASGRPVVVQDTGFSDVLPTGDGLLAFTTVEDAAAAVEEVRSRPQHHARAAREVAVECFDADRVLGRLLADAGL